MKHYCKAYDEKYGKGHEIVCCLSDSGNCQFCGEHTPDVWELDERIKQLEAQPKISSPPLYEYKLVYGYISGPGGDLQNAETSMSALASRGWRVISSAQCRDGGSLWTLERERSR